MLVISLITYYMFACKIFITNSDNWLSYACDIFDNLSYICMQFLMKVLTTDLVMLVISSITYHMFACKLLIKMLTTDLIMLVISLITYA